MAVEIGKGYYKMTDPKYKYSRAFCTEEDIEMAEAVATYIDEQVYPARHDCEGGWHKDEKLGTEARNKFYAELVKMGLTRTSYPKKLGGLERSGVLRNMLYMEVARGEVGLAMDIMHIHWPVSFMVAAKRDDLMEEFAPKIASDDAWIGCVAITEPSGAASLEDPATQAKCIRTTMKFEGDDVVLNGHKIWPGTGGPAERFRTETIKGHLGYWVVATTDPAGGEDTVDIVYVPPDAKGLTFSRPFEKMGIAWGDENVEIWLDNVRVPKRYVHGLNQPGMGGKIFRGEVVGTGLLGIASRMVGMSEAVFKIALDWTAGREIVGVPVREHSMFAGIIGEMGARIEAARNFVLAVTYQMQHPEIYGPHYSPEMVGRSCASRWFAGETAKFCTNKAMELMGSYGYSYDYNVEKYYRDWKILSLVLGGVQRDILNVAQGIYGIFKWPGQKEWEKAGAKVTEGFGAPHY
jgi:alkylation response protein AidB-like acyl-CoA dehydrogenase